LMIIVFFHSEIGGELARTRSKKRLTKSPYQLIITIRLSACSSDRPGFFAIQAKNPFA
jgi:hypothetical protein